jgi:TPR repeat protein
MYYKGKGVAQNILIAKEWYQKAADRENSHAINKLKRMADNDCIANRTRKRMKQKN